MKSKIFFCGLLLSGCLWYPAVLHAQQEPDEIALANNEFENNFYEALKQKGIENYDKAIAVLQKCRTVEPNNPVVYNELGKNYLSLKNYPEAEKAFLRATQLDPSNRWYWQGLYDTYYAQQDFNKCIPIVLKLTEWRKQYYQEDLVSLYMYTGQFDKALELIKELEETAGSSEKREMYKLQILANDKYRKPQKETLEEAIKRNPKEESNYIELIYLYSASNQEEKALEVAKMLEKQIPESDWAQVSLFKFHLNNNDGDKAAQSMFRVLGSQKIDGKIKHRILNEFLIYASNNPQYRTELDKAISYFEGDKEVNVAKEVAKFFFNKKDYTLSAQYLEKSLGATPDDIEAVELLLYSYQEGTDFNQLLKKSSYYIDLYPTQPRLYYFAGYAANRLNDYKKAKDFLESGIDFIVEDIELETGFNRELAKSYEGLGNTAKMNTHTNRVNELLKQKKSR